jgi:hypothetical protein
MELAPVEQLAFAFLRSQPQEIQKIAVNGNVEISALHSYFHRLSFMLDAVDKKRKNEIVEVESKPL